jgi:DNA polymerase-1
MVREACGIYDFNWRSLDHLRHLFYGVFRIPQSRLTKGGQQVMDRDALEKMEDYTIARPFIKHMKRLRELRKRLDVLEQPIDTDGRFRTSYNIAGTTTGRLSSSLSEFGTGGNAQNIEEFLRSIFIADDGMKMANFDAEQGESRIVGAIEWNLFKAGAYLDACESGDMHMAVARMCGLGPESRQMCKVLGHGTNYMGRPDTMSAHTHIPRNTIIDFQRKYFKAFPGHNMWHMSVQEQLRFKGFLISLMGRQRHFYGRRDSDDTLREAIAYDPQGSLCDIVNGGMLRVCQAGDCELLMQNHDSIVVQYPEEKEDEVVPKILSQLNHEIPLKFSRTLTIPFGAKTGWNWGDYSESNPYGLKKYQPGDKRTRS